MFATLLGALPTPPLPDGLDPSTPGGLDMAVEVAIRAQVEAGLEPITDGRFPEPHLIELGVALVEKRISPDKVLRDWERAQGLTDRAVKQALPGPRSLAERLSGGAPEAALKAATDALRAVVDGLAAAGCRLVEIEETAAHGVGEDARERQLLADDARERVLFTDTHRQLTDGVTGTHLSLSITGGAVAEPGWQTVVGLQYSSLAVDLIAGPDSWNLVTRWPGDRGVIVGAESAREEDEPKEVLLWAARYAASTHGRGIARVGIGSAGSYANLTWEAAVRKMQLLGTAARLAAMPPGDELTRSLDPRAVDARRAAMGHDLPAQPKDR